MFTFTTLYIYSYNILNGFITLQYVPCVKCYNLNSRCLNNSTTALK